MNSNFLNIFTMLSNSQNPMAVMQQMFGNNPAMQRALQMAQGKTEEQLKQTFYNMGKEAGIDTSFAEQFLKFKK